MPERVVITGVGAISPLGLSAGESWRNATEGISGAGQITLFDPAEHLVKIACEVKGFLPEAYMDRREARRRDRYEQFATAAASEAIRMSGLEGSQVEPHRIGVFVSSAIGGIKTFEQGVADVDQGGPRRISPFLITMFMPNGAAGMIGIDYGFRGPSLAVSSACASGADGIGTAWHLLQTGAIDAAVAGASDSTITPVGVAAFDRIGAMSRREPVDGSALMTPQPFDKERDGLVMGEGAGILVLETERSARSRGAEILAELAGYAANADAFHITAPSEDGSGGSRAIRMALETARINPNEVDYINAHGTGTPLNDLSETRAIKAAFGHSAYDVPISSTKSMTGHMMGATGALEAIFCTYAVRESLIPPTINYRTPDPECNLDYVPNEARKKTVNIALSNAFGFGGHNAVLVIKKYR